SQPSNHPRGDPKSGDDGKRKDDQKPAKIVFEQAVDGLAIALKQHRYEEKPRATGEKSKHYKERQAIGQKAARDRHDFERNGRQPFQKNDRPAPLCIKRAKLIDARAIAVKIDQPFADRFVKKRADEIAKHGAAYRSKRADQGVDPGALGPGKRHRDQNRVGRDWEKRAFGKGNDTERPRRARAPGKAQGPAVKVLEHHSSITKESPGAPQGERAAPGCMRVEGRKFGKSSKG